MRKLGTPVNKTQHTSMTGREHARPFTVYKQQVGQTLDNKDFKTMLDFITDCEK